MRQLRRSSAPGRRQTGQTDRLSRSNLAESERPAAVNQKQQGRQLQSWLPVCGTSQIPHHGELLLCSHLPCITGAASWHRQEIFLGVWQLDREEDASLHASLRACKSCSRPPPAPYTHPAPCKAHLDAGLGTLERRRPGKPRTWGLILVSGWNILHTSVGISNRPRQR